MDPLPLQAAPVFKSPTIPFLSKEPYGWGDFMTGPSRKCWYVPESDSPYLLKCLGIEVQSHYEVGAFSQTWLYFGLLFQNTKERVDTSLFEILDPSDGHYFSSVQLGKFISEWSVKALLPSHGRHRRRQDRDLEGWVAECYSLLTYADQVLDRIPHA